MKTKHISLIIIGAICLILALIIIGGLVKFFIIGEPIDGAQLHNTVSITDGTAEIHISTSDSAIALRGFKIESKGNDLYISGRKVLVSPFFDDGTHTITANVEHIQNVYLGGVLLWSAD